jgi:hypothetical protein
LMNTADSSIGTSKKFTIRYRDVATKDDLAKLGVISQYGKYTEYHLVVLETEMSMDEISKVGSVYHVETESKSKY